MAIDGTKTLIASEESRTLELKNTTTNLKTVCAQRVHFTGKCRMVFKRLTRNIAHEEYIKESKELPKEITEEIDNRGLSESQRSL